MADELKKLTADMRSGQRVISLSGLTSTAAKAYTLLRLQAQTGKHFAVVTDSNSDAEAWCADLEFFRSQISKLRSEISNSKSEIVDHGSDILTLPSFETDIYSGVSPH